MIGRVCSSTLDPTNYTSCSGASGHIELADLNAFLDWMANAGQVGGAPAGAVLSTVGGVVQSADTSTPTTTISCNGAPCSSSPYSGVVSVTLAATDIGSGVSVTRFTVDGTDPTTTSPTYTGAFNVNGSNTSTTVKFRSWDLAGNVEATNTQVIQAPPDTVAPTTTIACNGAACTPSYVGSVSVSLSATDTGGSGVAATYYTTDGSTPTTSSTLYASAFTLSNPGAYTVQFFSTDVAGNAEQVQSQQIQVIPVRTAVSLTFDNGTVAQYTLGYQQALQPHNAPATFFVNTGNVGVSAQIMTWPQLQALAAAGDEIGGKSVSATNLTTDPDPTGQVCDDRATLVDHGFDPVTFAYPGGAFNGAVEAIVKGCGYGTARTAGSLSPSGPTYAETLPPKDWFATRAYAPNGQVTLANMESLVTGAAAHGGGWSQIVIGRVCSQTADPANYTTCTTSAGWIELSDLNAFLDWMANAGQPGGAPAGAALGTMRSIAASADTVAPVSTAQCNGGACQATDYGAPVFVTLAATDAGSGVGSIHYTLDGSDPTLASPTYTEVFRLTAPTTVKYAAWDEAGNPEAVHTMTISAAPGPLDTTVPVTSITCNGGSCDAASPGKVTVTLPATDDISGVQHTYYTVDGSMPDTNSTVYKKPFTVLSTSTIRFFSVDWDGNQETPRSQQVTIQTIISLTFDDGTTSQYDLAFKQALKPHGMRGTFFIPSGLVGTEDHMTWDQLTGMTNGAQEIAGHTVDHNVNLKTETDYQTKVHEVCDDRTTLQNHGFDPVLMAYPFGAYDTTAEQIVQSCGYLGARAAGGIDVNGPGAGPIYAETVPPKDPVRDPHGDGYLGRCGQDAQRAPDAGDNRGRERRRVGGPRVPPRLRPDPRSGQLRVLHGRLRCDAAQHAELVPGLAEQRGPAERRTRRHRGPNDGPGAARARHHAADDVRDLRRWVVPSPRTAGRSRSHSARPTRVAPASRPRTTRPTEPCRRPTARATTGNRSC